MKRLTTAALVCACLAGGLATSDAVHGQSQVPIPTFTNTFSSATLTRGFQFQTPIPMTITGLRVPDESMHGMQNVALYKLAAKAPAFPTTAMSTPLFYQAGTSSNTTISLSVSFQTGDWIGILGACGDATTMRNSYGAAGPFQTQIQGNAVTMWRFITQTNIVQQMGNGGYSSDDAGNVSRVEVYYASASIVGSGTARPGTQMNYALSSPNDPGKPYLCASSLGTGPIPISGRLLRLSPDQLFSVSVSGVLPTVFVRYSGILDANGRGSADLNIPNITALIGTAIHTAFVTVDQSAPSGIQSVSDTFTFTIT